MDKETFRQLQAADWGSLGKELLDFAIWRARGYRWRSGSPRELTHSTTIEDVVQEVICKTISGERRWDPCKGPLKPWLFDQIKSVLDALAWSAPHRRTQATGERDTDEADSEDIDSTVPSEQVMASGDQPDPEAALLEKEEISAKCNALLEAIDGDPELQAIYDAIQNGCECKPRFLAEELGIPVSQVNNRLKRLRRRALAILEEKEQQ